MAERNGAFNRLEEQLKCAICLDTYTEPKLLSCNHVYCKDCLLKLVVQDQQGQLISTCPNCRHVTSLPADGVTGLRPAFLINNLLEILESLKNLTNQVEVKAGASRDASYCSKHVDEEIKLYCEQCEESICFKCVITDAEHHSHSYKTLDWYRGEAFSSLEPVKKQLSKSLILIDTNSKEIADQQSSIETSIDDIIKQMHEVLEVRKTKLVSQLHQISQRKLKTLAIQRDLLQSIQLQLQQYQDSIEEQLRLREMAKIKEGIANQIKEITSLFRPDTLKPHTSADMKVLLAEDITTLFDNYVTISAGELLPDPSKCFIVTSSSGLDSLSVGTPATAVLQAINHWGESCNKTINSLRFKLVSDITGKRVQGSVVKKSESQHELKFTPTVKGQHQLHVRINNHHIRGSPFTVEVKSSARNLCDQILLVKDLLGPWGVTVNRKNEMIVTEHDRHCVSVFSPSGKKLTTFGTHGSGEGQFNNPRGITLDGDGNILVADHNNHHIQIFTAEGQFLKQVGTKGKGPLRFRGPNDIAFNTHNKCLYIVDDISRVQVLYGDFTFCQFLGNGKLAIKPWGICCDRTGQVYVADSVSNQIKVFTAEGTFLKAMGNFLGGLYSTPVGVAFDLDNLMYVSSRFGCSILVLTGDEECLKEVGNVYYPRGLAVDHCGVVYVCDNHNDRICVY